MKISQAPFKPLVAKTVSKFLAKYFHQLRLIQIIQIWVPIENGTTMIRGELQKALLMANAYF